MFMSHEQNAGQNITERYAVNPLKGRNSSNIWELPKKAKLHSWRNKEQTEHRECLLSFGAETFAFQFAIQKYKCKGKGVPLQALCGPEGSRKFRLPDFHDIRHLKVVRSSPSRTGRLYPQECSWYSFSLGAESSPGPWHGREEIRHWKI